MMYIILLLIILGLMLIILLQNIKLKSITASIENVIRGSFYERVRVKGNNKAIKNLVINLNRLIDEFQKIDLLKKQYEEDRKKMISNISHDFRTPLTAILGYIEMLKTDKTLSEADREEYLEVISEKGEFLRNLIEEFFVLSKFDSGDIVLKPSIINITEVVRRCMLSFLKDLEGSSFELDLNIGEKEIFIEADEGSIYRVIHNLVSNAIRYGDAGKMLGVRLEEVKNQVELTIWDKGSGVAEEELPYIFKRLYTVDKSRNSKAKGSGLGLTIVKKIVEKHGGTIEVKSKPYEKTEFKIVLNKQLRNM
ncbi:sensor histidine kinase [Clostridium manihotivorum]|uniref:histidine kinase n=1 Tax=Clostridium manihotivorum TaxID=2320868 RepID=A0A3R5V565_9CLOT|nr:HAMP domain-containing sensor histidine kinase [Clostridium manihotivorum]QAA30496.1 sensor histidine kinase [Clostridium manihotivorum]